MFFSRLFLKKADWKSCLLSLLGVQFNTLYSVWYDGISRVVEQSAYIQILVYGKNG